MAEEASLNTLFAPPLGYLLAGVWGALWGSFFNVAIHRLAREDASLRSLLGPPSHCPACGSPIRARDNIPLLGWLLLGGRCRDCATSIPVRYPLVEALGVLASLAVYHRFVVLMPAAPPIMLCRFFIYFFFVGTLLVLALIDLDTMLLPEAITFPAIPFFFLAGRVFHDVSLVDAAVGLTVGFGALKGLQLGYAALTGREGLGGGDAMLMALVGGFLGWQSLPVTLGVGATLGTLVSVPLLWLRRRTPDSDPAPPSAPPSDPTDGTHPTDGTEAERDVPLRHVEVPFGPFLVAAALCHLFFARAAYAWLVGVLDRP